MLIASWLTMVLWIKSLTFWGDECLWIICLLILFSVWRWFPVRCCQDKWSQRYIGVYKQIEICCYCIHLWLSIRHISSAERTERCTLCYMQRAGLDAVPASVKCDWHLKLDKMSADIIFDTVDLYRQPYPLDFVHTKYTCQEGKEINQIKHSLKPKDCHCNMCTYIVMLGYRGTTYVFHK